MPPLTATTWPDNFLCRHVIPFDPFVPFGRYWFVTWPYRRRTVRRGIPGRSSDERLANGEAPAASDTPLTGPGVFRYRGDAAPGAGGRDIPGDELPPAGRGGGQVPAG